MKHFHTGLRSILQIHDLYHQKTEELLYPATMKVKPQNLTNLIHISKQNKEVSG